MTKSSEFDQERMMTEQAVAEYLEQQPRFFLRNRKLLNTLRIPHSERGAVSLVEMQLCRLRERVTELEDEITQLMTVAISNEQTYRAIAKAHTELFQAKSKAAIYQVLKKLGQKLNLVVSLRFYGNEENPLAKLDVQRIKFSHFAGNAIYQGRLRKADGYVFVEEAPELGSYLLIPIIVDEQELGFLSFASQDGGHFQSSMDTLFIEQLAQHIAATAVSLMRNP